MTHLGERASELVDGQLSAAATDRALAHVAACDSCRDEVEAQRLMKARLQQLSEPAPDAGLIAGLFLLGGPEGPLASRPGHVPGTPRPQTVPVGAPRPFTAPVGGRPPARPGTRGRVRVRPRTRVAAAMVGAMCLAGVAGAGGVASAAGSRTPTVVPPVESFAAEHAATTQNLPFVASAGWSGR